MLTPSGLIREQADPVTAIREMRANDVSTAYVIGRKMEFIGVVGVTAALQARRENLPSVAPVIVRDVANVEQNTLIGDIIGLASETPYPLAVLDDGGRLEGIVSRAAILSCLS
jgi:glycine betaine/proline transport system ATP-binding protein